MLVLKQYVKVCPLEIYLAVAPLRFCIYNWHLTSALWVFKHVCMIRARIQSGLQREAQKRPRKS